MHTVIHCTRTHDTLNNSFCGSVGRARHTRFASSILTEGLGVAFFFATGPSYDYYNNNNFI